MSTQCFDADIFLKCCNLLATIDKDLSKVIERYGHPPMWIRENSFATLVLTILEQQVSLASAYAANKRLLEKIKIITPQSLLQLTDEDLRQCSFTRQKIVYVRGLATALVEGKINLKALESETEQNIRTILKQLKGIGDWT